MNALAASLRDATAKLCGVSETPRLDAELLMAHLLGCTRSEMLLRQAQFTVPNGFATLLARRIRHEPVAYITGRQAFWDLELVVTPDVLIPRADSETLIEAALASFAGHDPPKRILDLGTGSGALLFAALSVFPQAIGIGIDASRAALAVAKTNAQCLGLNKRTQLLHRSWLDSGWSDGLDSFDLILCNPPYVEHNAKLDPMVLEHEPHSALFAGLDGLDNYRILLPQIPALLASHGIAIFEIGHIQDQCVRDLAQLAGLSTEIRRDLAGNPRALRFSLGIAGSNG